MLWEVCDVLCGMPVFSLGDAALLSWTLPEWTASMLGTLEQSLGAVLGGTGQMLGIAGQTLGNALGIAGQTLGSALGLAEQTLDAVGQATAMDATPWLFAAEESIFSGKSPAEAGQMVLHFVLLWTGMAVIVGSLAKLLLPGARPYGTCATMILGMFASTIGCFSTRYVFQEFLGRENFDPISLPGILVSVFVASVFLGFYQMVAKGVEPRE